MIANRRGPRYPNFMFRLTFLAVLAGSLLVGAVTACGSSSSTTPAVDAGVDAAPCDFDRSALTCDVTALSNAQLRCKLWVSKDPKLTSCPSSFGWTTGIGSGCKYEWGTGPGSPGPPNVCKLPTNGNPAAWDWLQPACDAGCP